MTLKHVLITSANERYDKKRIDALEQAKVKLEDAILPKFKTKEGMLLMQTEDALLHKVNEGSIKNLQALRTELKKLHLEPEKKQEIHITSDKKWMMFPQTIGDECGRTRYGKPEEFKVDVKIPFNKTTGVNFTEAVKVAREKALTTLKEYRKKTRELDFIEKSYSVPGLPVKPRYKVYAGGGYGEGKERHHIHLEKGTFMKLKEATKLRRVFEEKKPMTKDHHVGIEVEFVSKLDQFQLAQNLVDERVEEFVHLKTDGSLRSDGEFKHCHELTVLAPENLVVQAIERVLRAVNKDKASKVTKLCGLHVHLDMRNRNKQKAFANLVKAQSIMYAMNPASRLTGEDETGKKQTVYSKRVEQADLDAAIREASNAGDRYYGINVMAVSKFNTIEIRIHSGSTDFTKIGNWVKILMAIVNHKDIKKDISTPELMCETLELDVTMLNYIKERIAKFRDKNGKHVTVSEVA